MHPAKKPAPGGFTQLTSSYNYDMLNAVFTDIKLRIFPIKTDRRYFMQNIDERFKDVHPQKTVENIQSLLQAIGVETEEHWHDSGIDSCWSLTVAAKGGFPASNGKGVTKELARASAYGEFIERLQCGLFVYKFQSIIRDRQMDLQSYAPDGKYMTLEELEENGEWMDYVIQTYGGGLTRKRLAKLCRIYACADDGKIWTLPFYSIFEDKYVYLPASFVEQVYSANGCCAGNTREEAWVHAFSEMMERKSEIGLLVNAGAIPPIGDDVLRRFPTVTRILDKIRSSGQYDIQVFDASLGNGLPVIATRIINKKTHTYVVNSAADPVLEIAIHRTLTEIFQGRNLATFHSSHSGGILNEITDLPLAHNVMNQIETGNGMFTLDFFTEELSCDRACTDFADNSGKRNSELLSMMLDLYRALERPVYVRNYSYLGFNCYQFVVPGFSETRGLKLLETVPEFALGDDVAATLRDLEKASDDALSMMLMFHKKVEDMTGRRYYFGRLAGIPLRGSCNQTLMAVALAYGAYRLGRWKETMQNLGVLQRYEKIPEEDRQYFACLSRYLELKRMNKPEEKIRLALTKFFEPQYTDKLFYALDHQKTPFDSYLLHCDTTGCASCPYASHCAYGTTRDILASAGKVYKTFTDGQSREYLAI